MSDILDSQVLGRLTDEIDSDIPQEDVNEESWFRFNQTNLIESMFKKISEYELKYLIEDVYNSDNEYWKIVLKSLIRHFSLHSFKIYLFNEIDIFGEKNDIIKLIYFIKIILQNKLMRIKSNYFERENFINLLKTIKSTPDYFSNLILDLDDESYSIFIKKLLKESQEEYS
jgi:hypothetical protein